MSAIVYADFSRPDCYLSSRRVDALRAAGVDVDWRAVEHQPQPQLPVTGRRLTPADQDALVERFATLDRLLLPGEQLPWTAPGHAPKTEAAISAYAAVYGTAAGDDVRRLLFELYWQRGADIGSPTVLRTPLAGPAMRSGVDAEPLRQCGFAVSVDRGPITTDAHRRIRTWRDEWREMGSPMLPVLLVDGATLSGVDALRRLDKEITYADADANPKLADPRRYPPVQGRPSPAWVSQVGGRWRNIYRLTPTH